MAAAELEATLEALKPTSQPGAAAAGGASWPSRLGGLLRLLTCRRRRTPEEETKVRLGRYCDLLRVARQVPEPKKEWYDKLAWWSEAKTKTGARIFVLCPRGPQGETEVWIDMHELLAFAVNKMHESVVTKDQRFSVVWAQFNDHRMAPWSILSFNDRLHEKYAQNFEALHVLHPSWTFRIYSLYKWATASPEFWDAFSAHERIEFLDTHVDFKVFKLPKDLHEYDKWLDKQAMEMNQKHRATMGAGLGSNFFGGGFDEAERKKHEEQMQELEQLLKQKGYGGPKED